MLYVFVYWAISCRHASTPTPYNHSYLNQTGPTVRPVKDRTRALTDPVHLIRPVSNRTGIKPVSEPVKTDRLRVAS